MKRCQAQQGKNKEQPVSFLVGCGNEHHSSARLSSTMARLLAVCLVLCVALAPAALAQPPMAGQVRVS
jgi:hypothetical protein